VGNDGQFASFCGVIGRPDLPREQDFATNAARVAGRARLVGILAPLMAGRTTADWIAALEEAGVPCGPINTIDQVFADPQVQARGLLQPLARPDGSAIPLVANPIRMSATPPSPRRAPPSLGADTDHVLARYAGLEPAAIAALRRDRLVG
jgi:crotonobetainyl-CoA:carnitine CoA-transferase CaiB-like acyl-CoA transferase